MKYSGLITRQFIFAVVLVSLSFSIAGCTKSETREHLLTQQSVEELTKYAEQEYNVKPLILSIVFANNYIEAYRIEGLYDLDGQFYIILNKKYQGTTWQTGLNIYLPTYGATTTPAEVERSLEQLSAFLSGPGK